MESDKRDICLNDITRDNRLQPRAALDAETVAEYATRYENKEPMPEVTLFFDGETYWLADGYHRCEAAKQVYMKDGFRGYIPAEVRSGTFRDALLFAAGANAGHGLRRTNADKRRAVEMLLGEPECVGWSNEQIARHCRVGPHLVAEIRTGHLCENRDEASEAISAKTEMNAPSTRTVTRGGITYQMKTDNIGKRQAPGPVARDEKTATAPWRGSHPVYNAVGLLPCPFCGAQGPDFAHGPEGHAACCPHPDCNVVGPRKPTRDEAREGWNRRA